MRAGFLTWHHLLCMFQACAFVGVQLGRWGGRHNWECGHVKGRKAFSHHEGKSYLVINKADSSIMEFFLLKSILAFLKANPGGGNTLKDKA